MKEGWTYKKLGEVATFARGLTYSKNDEAESSSKVVLRSNNIDLISGKLDFSELKYLKETYDIPSDKRIKRGSLFICMSNGSKAHLGKVAYIDKDYNYAFGGFMGQITPTEEVDGLFLHYALCSPNYKAYIKSLSEGANINNLKFKDLSEFPLCYPPLSEQRTIVARLDSAFAQIDALKANAEKQLSEARKLFQKALEEAMTPKEGWEEKTLGDVGSFSRGINFAKSDFVKDGFPCIHYGQIHTTFGPVTYEHLTCIPNEMIRQDKLASKGNLIIAITSEDVEGSCKCTAWMGEYDIAVGAHAAIYKHKLHPVFVSYFFKSSLFQNEKEQYVHGFKVMEIKPSDIAKIHISYPSTEGQEQIVAHLDALFSHVRTLEEKLGKMKDECDALKQAMLREVFE